MGAQGAPQNVDFRSGQLILDFFKSDFRKSKRAKQFRAALGIPGYTKLPLLLLVVAAVYGLALHLILEKELELATAESERLQVRKTPSWPRSWVNFSPL